jgi:hypothetical protein
MADVGKIPRILYLHADTYLRRQYRISGSFRVHVETKSHLR